MISYKKCIAIFSKKTPKLKEGTVSRDFEVCFCAQLTIPGTLPPPHKKIGFAIFCFVLREDIRSKN